MSDRERLREVIEQRQWGALAAIVGANVTVGAVMIGGVVGILLLLLLGGIHALDWLGVLPCLCAGIQVIGIDQDIQQLEADIEADTRKIGLQLLQVLLVSTPVDTGYARGNWQVDFGTISPRVEGSRDAPPGVPTGGQIAIWQISAGPIIIHNSVEYIEFLDAGSSAQAPQGIIDPAIAATNDIRLAA